MLILLLGMLLFFGTHSISAIALPLRDRLAARSESAFLVWGGAVRVSLKRRPVRPVPAAPPSKANDFILVVLGLAVYGLFAFWLHARWFGVDPLIGL